VTKCFQENCPKKPKAIWGAFCHKAQLIFFKSAKKPFLLSFGQEMWRFGGYEHT
jgi:hypothetical protein